MQASTTLIRIKTQDVPRFNGLNGTVQSGTGIALSRSDILNAIIGFFEENSADPLIDYIKQSKPRKDDRTKS